VEDIMTLHDNRESFYDAIRAASDHLGVREVFVEKDYWVTFILKRLSQSQYRDKVVFKGGTALSKAFGLIDRFSEDIDLAIIQNEGQSNHKIGKLIKSIQNELTAGFREVVTENTSQKKNFRKNEYEYDRLPETGFKGSAGMNRNLVLEINSLANPVPNERLFVNSFVGRFLEETGQTEMIKKYDLGSFELNVLVPRSTMIEKILSIIRLSYFPDYIDRLKGKVRHFYDIYFLATSEHCKKYISTKAFKDDFKRMYLEDKTKFDNPENWLKSDYKESSVFNSFDEIWQNVRSAYEADLKLLVLGRFPGEKEVADKFKEVIKHLE
jgi:hypothetical protein